MQRRTTQDLQQGGEPLDALDAVCKHHGAGRVLKQEVIKVEVLVVLLTVDQCFSQCLHRGLLPGEVDDFGLGLHPQLIHENFQFAPVVQLLPLLQEAAGQTVSHRQSGREHKGLSRGVEVCSVQHFQ